jgi:CRP-like cAMP-binding protein
MGSKKNKESTVSHDSIATLKELCLMHGDDPTLHVRLAEHLFAANKEVAALLVARKAYQILKKENPCAAGDLVARYGELVAIDDTHPPASKSYMPLASIFKKVLRRKHELILNEGDVLYRKGEPADSMYLILDGELAVNVEVNGVHSLINYLHSGNLVGKSIQKKDRLRSATVSAVKASKLLRFTEKEIEQALVRFPDLLIQFSKEGMLRQRVEILSSMPLFSRVPLGIRFVVASRSWTTSYNVGDVIKEANHTMHHIGLIFSGVVHLYDEHEDDVPIYCGRMGVGDLLGLQKLMHKEAKGLVIKAESNCEMLCMSFTDIEDIMDEQPAVRQKLMDASGTFSEQMIRTILLQKQMKETAKEPNKEEGI